MPFDGWRTVLSHANIGRCLTSIFGREFLFLLSCCGLVFSVVFCQLFCLLLGFFSPEMLRIKSLLVRSSFLVRSLFLRARADDVWVFFGFFRDKLGANRTPHFFQHVFVGLFFSVFRPRRICVIARSGRASFLFWCFLGLPFWALRVLELLDSIGISWGLSSLAPSKAFFLRRKAAGVFVSILLCCFAFPLLSRLLCTRCARRPAQ